MHRTKRKRAKQCHCSTTKGNTVKQCKQPANQASQPVYQQAIEQQMCLCMCSVCVCVCVGCTFFYGTRLPIFNSSLKLYTLKKPPRKKQANHPYQQQCEKKSFDKTEQWKYTWALTNNRLDAFRLLEYSAVHRRMFSLCLALPHTISRETI